MNVILSSIAALIFFAAGSVAQMVRISGIRPMARDVILWLTFLGAFSQMLALYGLIHVEQGINLGIFVIISLTILFILTMVLLSSIRKPSDNLLVLFLPVACLSVLMAWLFPFQHIVVRPKLLLVTHVLVSVLAYGVLLASMCQSLLLSWQETRLRSHASGALIKVLPPIQVMEKLMFEFLLVGEVLLTFSLASGFLFFDNMFAHHLIQKTMLSLIAWCVFAYVLIGRVMWGWRGDRVMRWVVIGAVLLAVAFFGWRLILVSLDNVATVVQ
ncbi:Inner membrane protein YpjD [invertebrate metagenome]|uniref:Inner membrane protein YpjD n=1 Tax=invertebrate metagenome TaxID=1711999 RepID=A0A2H9T9S9_9ZZZZ